MYPHTLGENIAQTQLLSFVDYQQGIFNLVVLDSKVLKPLFPTDYKATQMKVKLGDIHLMDMIELHQQASDMLYRGVLQSFANERKMQNMVIEIGKQLKRERVATKSNRIQINELERKIISLGEDPKNLTIVEDLIKEKGNEIKILKKKLNVPNIQHVHTPELQASHEEKDKIY